MAGNNPRKFKDRIALLNQKEAESTAQFQAVMGDMTEVKKTKSQFPPNFDGGGGSGAMGHLVGAEAMMPRHLAPSLPNHHPHFRYGGSLPNVAQMSNVLQPVSHGTSVITTSASPVSSPAPDIQFPTMPGLANVNNVSPGLDQSQQSPVYHNMVGSDYSDTSVLLRGASDRSRGSGGISPVGGGAIRNRSGERRYDSSPYSDRYNYSSSLVTSYLSPPPESRWRRTSSDSALYQKLTGSQQQQSPATHQPAAVYDNQSPSEGGSPEYCSQLEDVKPPRALLQSLLQETVKEEPGVIVNGGGSSHYHSGSSSPVSPLYTTHQSFQPPPPLQQQHPSQQHNNLEEKFEKFRLDCPPPSGTRFPDNLQHNPGTPTTGPTSPHTPSTLPDIYIQDWSQHCNDKSLEDDFDELRESLDPIDDQLLATLTNSATFVDPAVEEQFKMNYS